MNCEEVNAVLDSRSPGALTLRQRQDIDRHFVSCAHCRAAWAAYGELAALTVPPAPHDLRSRVAAALAARASRPAGAIRRSLVVGSVVLAGAAAATLAVQYGRAPRDLEHSSAELALSLEPSSEPAPVTAPGGDPAAAGTEAADSAPERARSSASEYPLDPYSVVVLAMPNPAIDVEGAAAFAECHAQVVQELSAAVDLNTIAGERVAPYVGSVAPAEETARVLGAGTALVLTTADAATIERVVTLRASLGLESRIGSCVAELIDARTGAVLVDARSVRPDWQPEHWQSFAVDLVERIAAAKLADPQTVLAEARAKVLDATLGDAERALAVAQLRQGAEYSEPIATSAGPMPRPLLQLGASVEPILAAFDDAVVAAIVQLGSTSPVVRARESAWRHARGVRHPQLVAALMTSLERDAHPNVRRAAALALGYLADEPGVNAALTRAAEQDSDVTAPIPCCVPSVRGAALRALSSDDEIRAAALRTVQDASLSDEERLRPLTDSLDGRAFPLELDDGAARAVFAVGAGTADPLLRSRAWNGLRLTRNDDFARTLLADLAAHPAEAVRTSAAGALRLYVDDAGVRAALERARGDASVNVRRAAQAALAED